MGSTALALCLGAVVTTEAEARITRIEIKRVEAPTFEGKAIGSVGAYEKLERYPAHEADVNAVRAANALKAERLLLEEDVQDYVRRAEASQVGR